MLGFKNLILIVFFLNCLSSTVVESGRPKKNTNRGGSAGKSLKARQLSNDVSSNDVTLLTNEVPILDDLHTCQVFGDSHITTFDGSRYSVWGGVDCTYILALDCYYASWLVYITFAKCGEVGRSVSSIVIYKDRTVVMLNRGWQVYTDRGQIRMQEGRSRHLGSGLVVQLFPEYLRVHFQDYSETDVTLFWDGWETVTITTEAVNTCGLCGNNNGNDGDEFLNLWFHGEDLLELPSAFVSSWVVGGGHAECGALEQNKTVCSASSNNTNTRCEKLINSAIFKAQCLESDVTYYLKQCNVDLCYKMDLDTVYPTECQIASSLAELCEARGGRLKGWQEQVGCPETCAIRTAVFSTGCPLSYYPWLDRCPGIGYYYYNYH